MSNRLDLVTPPQLIGFQTRLSGVGLNLVARRDLEGLLLTDRHVSLPGLVTPLAHRPLGTSSEFAVVKQYGDESIQAGVIGEGGQLRLPAPSQNLGVVPGVVHATPHDDDVGLVEGDESRQTIAHLGRAHSGQVEIDDRKFSRRVDVEKALQFRGIRFVFRPGPAHRCASHRRPGPAWSQTAATPRAACAQRRIRPAESPRRPGELRARPRLRVRTSLDRVAQCLGLRFDPTFIPSTCFGRKFA